jgi:RND family efflux transporter MFP subunit
MKTLPILSSLALLLAALGCRTRQAAPETPLPAARVHLAAETGDAAQGWVAVTLGATRRATLSTRMAAMVKKVHVLEGQTVAAGALLVSLADEDLQGGLRAAEAGEAAAAAQFRRMENLSRQDAAIPAEVDLARTQLAQARAALAAARANLAYTRIRAPFAGVVQARRVQDGDFAGPGTPLVELEGQGGLEFTGSLSAAEARDLKAGMELPFEAEGRTGSVRITALAPGGDPVSHRSALRALVVRGGEGLRPGAFGRIRVPGRAAEKGLSVPRSALVRRGELNGVFVARNGKAELRWLSLGDPQGDRIAVRAGMAEGEQIIDQPGALRDGQSIEVTK